MSPIQPKSTQVQQHPFVTKDIQLDANPQILTSAIEAVESRHQRVKIFRGAKVVAEIVPGIDTSFHETSELLSNQANGYRTWGESLS